ncbi:MAG: hypothetical protein ACHQQR_16900, partial [Gemmatimonadales bacterium]
VRLFEIGSTFVPEGDGLPREEMHAAALVMGARRPVHFSEPKPPAFDAWDAKALAETIARAAFPGAKIMLLPGEGGELWSVHRHVRVGSVCMVSLDAPVWASPAFGVEITLGPMPSEAVAASGKHDYAAAPEHAAPPFFLRYAWLPTTPAAEFDLALIVPDDMPARSVESVISSAAGEFLERLELFDQFRGAGVPAGHRSLAWRLTFRHPERTLRDKEIDGRRSQLLKTLEKELGVVARTS